MNRFYIKESEGSAFGIKTYILVDRSTGVNYLFTKSGYGAGLTVLVDENGMPIISEEKDDEKKTL